MDLSAHLRRPPAGKAPAASREISKADYEALAQFRFRLRCFLHFIGNAARSAGLTPQQHQALLAIKGCPGRDEATVSELAESLLLRHHSAVELVDRLARLGLVRREVDRSDGRRVLISLTRKAENLLAGLSASHLAEVQQLGPALTPLFRHFEDALRAPDGDAAG